MFLSVKTATYFLSGFLLFIALREKHLYHEGPWLLHISQLFTIKRWKELSLPTLFLCAPDIHHWYICFSLLQNELDFYHSWLQVGFKILKSACLFFSVGVQQSSDPQFTVCQLQSPDKRFLVHYNPLSMVSLNHCCSSLVLHSRSLTPCWWDGGEDQKNKRQKKTCSLRKIQFHSQNKSCTSKQGISSPLGQAGVQPSLGKGSITHVGDMGRQNLSLQMPPCPSFLLPPAFYTEHDGSGIFLGSVGVSWPGCVGPSFMYTPNLPADGVGWEAEKILSVCNHCSAVKKISQNY